MILANEPAHVKGWAKIPHVVTLNPSITPTAKTVLAALMYLAKSRPSCSPTDAEIGQLVDRSARTVSVCLKSLESAGLIRREATPRLNVAGRVIHLTIDDGAKPAAAPHQERPTSHADVTCPPLPTAAPQAADRVSPSGEDPSSHARSSMGIEKKIETVGEDAPTIVQSLKPETVEAVADRLITIFRDDVAYRGKYVRAMRDLASGRIALERGVYAAKEAAKRSKVKGLAFFGHLESTTPIPEAKVKPRADDPEVAGLLVQARSGEERARNAAVGSLLGLGFTIDEVRGLFAAAPTTPVPPPAPMGPVTAPEDSPFSTGRRWWRSFIVSK